MRQFPLRFITIILPLFLLACGEENNEPADTSTPIEDRKTEVPERDGTHEMRDKEGRLIMRGEKIGGERHGNWESYFPDGALRSRVTYQHGSREGTSTVFHENGAPYYIGLYRNDQMVGDWLFYDKEGNTVKVVRYDNEGNKVEEKAL